MLGTLFMTTLLTTHMAALDGTSMSAAELGGLLTGNTLYILVAPKPDSKGTASAVPFKFGADRTSAARLSEEMTLVGRWQIDGDKYCVDWDNGPKNSCSRLIREAGEIRIVDAANGKVRGRIEKIVPGNPEQL